MYGAGTHSLASKENWPVCNPPVRGLPYYSVYYSVYLPPLLPHVVHSFQSGVFSLPHSTRIVILGLIRACVVPLARNIYK